MPKFRVLINAINLSVPLEDSATSKEISGFFTNRYVSAENREIAKEMAINKLLQEDKVQSLIETSQNRATEKPEFVVDEIEEVSFFSNLFAKKQGFIFYSNEEEGT